MEEALAKIRPHTSSSLPHQKAPATLLIALESTLKEQKADLSSTAYFASLLTTLDGILQRKDTGLGNGDVLPAALYLLALIIRYVPAPVIRANLDTILNLTTQLFPSLNQHAPPLRSQLSISQGVFRSLDRSQLDVPGVRQMFASVLQVCMDPRPKVRRKAAEVVKDVLSNPPAPLARHPYSDKVAEWIAAGLTEASRAALFQSKTSEDLGTQGAIHILAFLRPNLPHLPPTSLPAIIKLLLSLPRLGNHFLSQSVYIALADLFNLPQTDEASRVNDHISEVLNAVLAHPPNNFDTTISPAWLNLVGNGMLAYGTVKPDLCASEVGRVWKMIWKYLDSPDQQIRKSAADALENLCQCFSTSLIQNALSGDQKSAIPKIIREVQDALGSLAYARAMPELMSVVSSLISNLKFRPDSRSSPTAAETLLSSLIINIGNVRTQKHFEHKEKADLVLATAMRVLGPEAVLKMLPLNLEPTDRNAGQEPRAFLLPLLSQPHPSPLGYFVSYFIPLSERMFDLQQKAEMEGRPSEAKVWSVLVSQVWAGLSSFCWAPVDLKQSLSPSFSQLLSQLLYSQPELRQSILKALKTIVDSNVAVASPGQSQIRGSALISASEASENIVYLRTQAESWLAVFFNIFGTADRNGRALLGEVISSWASIAGNVEIQKVQSKVIDLFKKNMAQLPKESLHNKNDADNSVIVTQDILVLLLPYISSKDAQLLFQLILTHEVLTCSDHAVQKRGYKILTKLVESGKVAMDAEETLHQLDALIDGLAPAAKKDRFNLLSSLVPALSSTSLHIIPSLIPEAVLGTKEPSEKARSSAFELIVTMGKKMQQGGTIVRNKIDGMDEDGANETPATAEEYLTMIAGGLAGATPHMISATVTAISRLTYEYKDVLSTTMQTEVFTTSMVFLSSANREIVKSVLGFVKLAVHTLPTEVIRPHLKTLVPALLSWSHDHKNHFKAKVRHIFERMIRRFGWDEVYSSAGQEEAAKVLINIKKRKDRAKRKKMNTQDDENDQAVLTATSNAGDTFEDILYGSESELDTSDEEDSAVQGRRSGKKPESGDRLRVDNEEPIDLLQGAAARVTSKNARRRKPGQDAAHFRTDVESGKMVIEESAPEEGQSRPQEDLGGAAYRETLTSVDGFTRGPHGRVKFNKDTKKRRREANEFEDVEMADEGEASAAKTKKNKRKTEIRLGQEFKAKKAGGDVKKGKVDPYAYLPLADAARGGRRGHNRIKITH